MTIEYKKMSKTNEKLEWGRYAEYLNFKFVFDFDQLEKGEHKHLSAVTATVTKTLLVGAISAYFSAKIALLQWASISIIVAVIQGLTILNTPSYETSSMKVTSILFSIAFGCTVSSILNNSLGINTWMTAVGLLKCAAFFKGYSSGCFTFLNQYGKIIKMAGPVTPKQDKKVADKLIESEIEPESRFFLYFRTIAFSTVSYVLFDHLVNLVLGIPVASLESGALIIGGLSLFSFLHSQFIIAKSGFYDRHAYTQVIEMFIESAAMIYYLPKSIFFSALN